MATLPANAAGEVRLTLRIPNGDGTDSPAVGYAWLYPNLRPGTMYRASNVDPQLATRTLLEFDGSGNLEDPETGTWAKALASDAPGASFAGMQWVLEFHLENVKTQPAPRFFTIPAGSFVNVGLLADTSSQPAAQTVYLDAASGDIAGLASEVAALSADIEGTVAKTSDDIGYDVILVAGQSNARGFGSGLDTTYLDPPHPRIKQWPGSGALHGQIVTAVDPLFHVNQGVNVIGGAMPFAREYVQSIDPHRRVLIVPAALGSTGFSTTTPGSWDPSGGGDINLYQNAIAETLAALATDSRNRLVAIYWVQGESDTAMGGTAYRAKLDQLIDGFRSALSAPDVPFIVGQMVPTWVTGAGGSGAVAVNAAHIDTPRRKTRTAFAYGPSGLVESDGIHYTGAGQRILGARMYAQLAFAAANVLGVAPVAPSAVALTQSGTSVLVAWTRQLGRVTDYFVEYKVGAGSWAPLTRAQSIDTAATITGQALGSTVQVRVSAVNEQGTSTPSSAATLTLASSLGQVTGLTAGAAGSTSQALTWSAMAGASSYVIEYKRSADSTWTVFGEATGNAGTVTGLTPLTGYDYRVSAKNAAGTGAVSGVVTKTTTAPATVAADVGVTPAFAVGTRRLVTGYSGPAVRVRRSTDNVEQDIGLNADGTLDTAALATFAGSATCTVKTVYDQSGNGRNYTAPADARQPTLVAAGVLQTLGGKPAMKFSGTSNLRNASPSLYAAGAASLLMVMQYPTSTAAAVSPYTESKSAGASSRYLPAYLDVTTAGLGWIIANDANATLKSTFGPAHSADGLVHQVASVDTGTAVSTWLDGANQVNASAYTRSGVSAHDTATIGGWAAGDANFTNLSYTGSIPEIVGFGQALSTAQRQAGEGNQKAFYGTP